MDIPFTVEEFFQVFERYNLSLWPVQVILFVLALAVLFCLYWISSRTNKMVFTILAILWMWMGVVYHIVYFSSVNQAAYLFGALFIIQGLILFYFGVAKEAIPLHASFDAFNIIGGILIFYAVIGYPILGHVLGHMYPQAPTFGVPCPTTIFTFGVLLSSIKRVPWYVLVIPFLWSILGFFAAIELTIKEDFGLLIAGIVSTVILAFFKPKKLEKNSVTVTV
ncbi:MAG TPA: DUF6064 family protein [Chryseolinea sp.]